MNEFQRGYWDAQMCIAYSILIAAEMCDHLPKHLKDQVAVARMFTQRCIEIISPNRKPITPEDIEKEMGKQ